MSDAGKEMDDDALAGEYVLRLLDPDETRRFETRMSQDAGLAALVRDWEARLAPMLEEVEDVPPPARLKTQVETHLFSTPAAKTGLAWRLRTVLAGGAAIAAIVVLLLLSPTWRQPDFIPQYGADLASEAEGLRITADFDPESGSLLLTRVSGIARPGRVHELWLIAEGAEAPVSLGVLSAAAEIRIDIPENLLLALPGGTLAISDEPPSGSPTGLPTGDVLATAPVARI